MIMFWSMSPRGSIKLPNCRFYKTEAFVLLQICIITRNREIHDNSEIGGNRLPVSLRIEHVPAAHSKLNRDPHLAQIEYEWSSSCCTMHPTASPFWVTELSWDGPWECRSIFYLHWRGDFTMQHMTLTEYRYILSCSLWLCIVDDTAREGWVWTP